VTCSGSMTDRRRLSRLKLGRRTRNSGGSAAARSAAWRETLRPGRTPGHSRQVTTPAGRCATLGRGRPERRLVRDPAPKANDRCLFGLLRFAARGRVERDAPILDLLQPRTNKSNRPLAVIAAARNSDTSAAWTVRARTRLSACRLQCVEHRGERIYRFLDRSVQNCLISMQREFGAAGRHLGCRADCDAAVDELLG
jgi:hypothetical protein